MPWSVEVREGDWTAVGMAITTYASPYYDGSQIDLPTSGSDHGTKRRWGKWWERVWCCRWVAPICSADGRTGRAQ